MSRISTPINNQLIEYFFNIFKLEWWILISTNEKTLQRLETEIKKFKHHYNNIRFQSNLGNKTPLEYKGNNL